MTFTDIELKKLKKEQLIKLANYLDIYLLPNEKANEIIKKILDVLNPKSPIEYLEGETPERPLYSVRVRRALQSQKEK